MIEARRRARSLRRWLFRQYELLDNEGQVVDYRDELYWPYLVQIARGVQSYKRQAQSNGILHRELGHKGLGELDDVELVLEAAFEHPAALHRLYLSTREVESPTFAWEGPRFTVRRKDKLDEDENCG
jgi:hypothetical protein